MNIESKKKTVRKLSYVAFGFFAASFFSFTGGEIAQAEGLEVSGYIDTLYNVMKERRDTSGDKANTRRDFSLTGEIDLERNWSRTGVRLDVDVNPLVDNTAQGISNSSTFAIEQARSDWWLPVGEEFMATLTVGAWNGLLGFEAQDAPDLLQISTGQLFDLVPANMLGVNLSGGMEQVTGNIFVANEWRNNTAKENSVGASISLKPMEEVSLKVGGIINPDKSAKQEGIVNLVAETTIVPMVLLAGEFTAEHQHKGYGIVVNVTHETEMPHWLTLRYDGVWTHAGSGYGVGTGSAFGFGNSCLSNKCDFQTVTAAMGVEVTEGVAAILEYRAGFGEVEVSGGTNVSQDLHEITVEWVATF